MNEVISWPKQTPVNPNINVEGEAAFLGAVLIDNRILEEMTCPLKAEHFYAPVHGRVFARLTALIGRKEVVTPVTLKPYFETDDGLKELGGNAYLARLTADGQGLLAPRELAHQIYDLAARRRAIEALLDPDRPIGEVGGALQTQADALAIASGKGLPIIDYVEWRGEPPSRRSAWGWWLPSRTTTMLTGLGGIGKSLFAQMLCTAICLGLPFLGMETHQANCLYVTCEDDEHELWRRQTAICAAFGVSLDAIKGRLHLVSLAGQIDTVLGTFDDAGRIQPSTRWRQIVAAVDRLNIGVMVFDGATDAMGGDLNDIHQVAEFVNLLTGLAIRIDGSVMILHHPSKAGADWLGSVAWTNKVRSRLLIEQADESDPDSRVIINPKANYGPTGQRIEFRWHNGAFVKDDDLPESVRSQLDDISGANAANAAFLRCLAICTEQRRNVSHMRSPNFAPRVFVRMPEGKGHTVDGFDAAMERLLHLGVIEIDAELWTDAHRHTKRGIRLKPGDT